MNFPKFGSKMWNLRCTKKGETMGSRWPENSLSTKCHEDYLLGPGNTTRERSRAKRSSTKVFQCQTLSEYVRVTFLWDCEGSNFRRACCVKGRKLVLHRLTMSYRDMISLNSSRLRHIKTNRKDRKADSEKQVFDSTMQVHLEKVYLYSLGHKVLVEHTHTQYLLNPTDKFPSLNEPFKPPFVFHLLPLRRTVVSCGLFG